MKQLARVQRQDLPHTFKLIGKVIERRTTIPVLGHVRLTGAAPDRLIITATDLDIEMCISVPAETIDFDITMPAPAFLSFMEGADGAVTFSRCEAKSGGGFVHHLSDGEASMQIRDIIPAADVPEFKPRKEMATVTASEDEVNRLFRLGRHCISSEETRYYLNGTFITPHPDGNGTLRAVTTDGHRMGVIDCDAAYPAGSPGLIVPVKMVDLILGATRKGGNAQVKLTARDESQVSVVIDDTSIHAKTIDGTFPDYTRVIPDVSVAKVTATVTHDAIKRLNTLAVGAGCGGRGEAMTFTGGQSDSDGRMAVRTPYGARVEMAAQCAGGTFGVNRLYMLQQSLITRTMKLEANCLGDPIRVLGDDPRALWVMMPMRV